MSLLRRSILPSFFRNDWWDSWDYPTRLLDQHFGTGLFESDLLSPSYYRGYLIHPRTHHSMETSGKSEVVADKDNFKVILNVSQFKPSEIDVKTIDNFVVIHGKHEERTDEHGFVSREFTRRYMLPQGVEPDTVKSSLSPDGLLTIQAPRKALEPPKMNERVIPITMQQPAVEDSKKNASKL